MAEIESRGEVLTTLEYAVAYLNCLLDPSIPAPETRPSTVLAVRSVPFCSDANARSEGVLAKKQR